MESSTESCTGAWDHIAFAFPIPKQTYAIKLHVLQSVSHNIEQPTEITLLPDCRQTYKTWGLSLQVTLPGVAMRHTERYWKHVGDWEEDGGHCTQTRPTLEQWLMNSNQIGSIAILPGNIS